MARTAKKTVINTPILSSTNKVSFADIQKKAYFIWKAEGSPSGKDKDIWFKAEKMLKSTR